MGVQNLTFKCWLLDSLSIQYSLRFSDLGWILDILELNSPLCPEFFSSIPSRLFSDFSFMVLSPGALGITLLRSYQRLRPLITGKFLSVLNGNLSLEQLLIGSRPKPFATSQKCLSSFKQSHSSEVTSLLEFIKHWTQVTYILRITAVTAMLV